jgi:hypothetical protein
VSVKKQHSRLEGDIDQPEMHMNIIEQMCDRMPALALLIIGGITIIVLE